MSGLGSFETARALRELVKGMVSEELKSQRPAPRYATVQSIDHEARSCMVVYVGEDVPVRVPYNGTGPANIGQEVRIEGMQSDRVITDVRGTTSTEGRVVELEGELAARSFIAGRWRLGMDFPFPEGDAHTIPISVPGGTGGFFPSEGLEMASSGELTVRHGGYYMINGTVVQEGPGRNANGGWNRAYLHMRTGTEWLQIKEVPEMRDHDGGNADRLNTHQVSDLVYLDPDSVIAIRVGGSSSSGKIVYGSTTGRMNTGLSIHSVFLGPRPEEPEF